MKSIISIRTVVSLVVSASALVALAAEPSFTAEVNAREIYFGDAFQLVVALDHVSADGASPIFSDSVDATISGGQPRTLSESFSSTINGRRTMHVVERTSWVYLVTPENLGNFEMGKVTLQAAGRTFQTQIPSVRVIGPEAQPYVSVSLTSSRPFVLLDEPFDVLVDVIVTRLSGQYEAHDPLPDGRQAVAALEIPFFADGAVSGAVFSQSLEQLLNPLLQRRGDTGAFGINNFSVNSGAGMFSLFSEPRLAVFNLSREPAERDGQPAWMYRLRIPMKAASEGVCRFGSIRFKGQVLTEQEGKLTAVSVFTVSKPLDVRVTPPPEEGRPETFIGSLGTRMTASVSLDAQTCRQGDPLQLTLEISGDQTTANMREPRIFDNTELAERFRQYGDVSSDRTPTGMRYLYRIRPIESGTIEVPPLELAFYNTEAREYEVIRTAPVPLRVDPAPEIDLDAILGLSTNASAAQMAIRRERVPSAITLAATALSPAPSFAHLRVVRALCAPPVAALLVVGLLALWRRRRSLRVALRRRSAVSRSVRGMLRAKTPEAVMCAVGVFLRDKAGAVGEGFTPHDVRAILAERGVDAIQCDEIEGLLQEVFDSGFRPDVDSAAIVKAKRGRIAGCLAALRFSVLVLVTVGWATTASAAPDRARSFLWQQAQAEMASAKTAGDFLRAARVYREVIDGERLSGGVLYNYGTALLLADLPKAAMDAFARAEALDGASPELENNLDLALIAVRQATEGDPEQTWQGGAGRSALPWYRVPLFWHYRAPVAVRMDALILAWWVLWIGVIVKAMGWRRSGRGLATAGLLGVAVFGSSVLASYRVLDRPLPALPDQVQNGRSSESVVAP